LGKQFVVEIDESPSATKKQCITDIGLNSSSGSLKESTTSSLDNIQTSPEKINMFESMTIESVEQAVTRSNTRLSVVTRAVKTDEMTRPNYTDSDSDMDDDDPYHCPNKNNNVKHGRKVHALHYCFNYCIVIVIL